jgi:hypothetical protein
MGKAFGPGEMGQLAAQENNRQLLALAAYLAA